MRITTPANPNVQVVGTVPVQQQPDTYGASFNQVAATLANTAVQIVAPGANVNGINLQFGSLGSFSGTNGALVLIAKASAPATIADGDVLLSTAAISGGQAWGSELPRPVKIPAGKGLYLISTTALPAINNNVRTLHTIL